jgi:hypothetical protein
MNTCNECHELVDKTTGLIAAATHRQAGGIAPNTDDSNIITDTHYATTLNWSSVDGQYTGVEPAATGYAMDFASETACADCHAMHGENESIRKEWAKSAHADRYALTEPATGPESFFSTAWAHYNWTCDGTSTTACGTGTGRKACQRCHTTTAFKAYANALRRGDISTAAAINSGAAPPIPYSAVSKPEMLKCDGCPRIQEAPSGIPSYRQTMTCCSGIPLQMIRKGPIPAQAMPIPILQVPMSAWRAIRGGERNTIKNLNAAGMPAIDLNSASFINSHYLTGGGTVFAATGYGLRQVLRGPIGLPAFEDRHCERAEHRHERALRRLSHVASGGAVTTSSCP